MIKSSLVKLNDFQRKAIAIGLALFILSILYVPIDQAYWLGPSGVKSGFLGNWTWITSLHSTYTSFYAGDIPATISFPIIIVEWLILGIGCGLFVWVNRDKLIKEQDAGLSLSDKVIVEPIYVDHLDSEDDYDNQLQESEIYNYKSLEEFVANRPDISRAQCEALWDYFGMSKKPKEKRSVGLVNSASAWPLPKDGG